MIYQVRFKKGIMTMKIRNFVKKAFSTVTAMAIAVGSMVSVPTTQVEAGFRDTNIDCGQVQTLPIDKVKADPVMRTVADEFNMYRLYNPNSGEHFYTRDNYEMVKCINYGWQFEGLGWVTPKTTDVPVYRVYNPNNGYHHYTVNQNEYEMLVNAGWSDEGIHWFSSTEDGAIPMYREYNPATGQHNYTAEWGEHAILVTTQGWNDEGIAWYGNANSLSKKAEFQNTYGVADSTHFGLLDTFIELGYDTYYEREHFGYYCYMPSSYDDVEVDFAIRKNLLNVESNIRNVGLHYNGFSAIRLADYPGDVSLYYLTFTVGTQDTGTGVDGQYDYYQVITHKSLYNGYYRTDLPADGLFI